jgi:hypothetical protein
MLLIGAGVVLLLNTLGIVEWSIWWSILRLWPVLLIAAGLDLLLGRYSIWGSLLAVLLVVGVVVGALWLSQSGLLGDRPPTQEVRQPLAEGVTEATIHLEPQVGILRIEDLPETADLVRGQVHTVEGEDLQEEYSRQGNHAAYALTTSGQPWVPFVGSMDTSREWRLGLTPAATMELETMQALGEARLNLKELSVSELRSNMGLGVVEIRLPQAGQYEARLSGAIGETKVILPEGLAARIRVEGGLVLRQMPDNFEQEGDYYTSPGFASASNQVELQVNQAMGFLQVKEE